MRITQKGKVYLVGRTALNIEGIAAFLQDNGLQWPTQDMTDGKLTVRGSAGTSQFAGHTPPTDAEQLVELAGRCCYMSFGKKAGSKSNAEYLDNLLGRNPETGEFIPGPAHGSVTEHPVFNFLVVGAGRGFSHEQVRHRVGWAYSQLSTRYCDFEREEEEGTWDPGFSLAPMHHLGDGTIAAHMRDAYESAVAIYKLLVDRIHTELAKKLQLDPQLEGKLLLEHGTRGLTRMLRKAARGAARDVLPIGTEAIMTMSANPRAIWNCLVLRANEHAEAAIREIYIQIARIMEKEMPTLFRGIQYKTLWDSTTALDMPRDKL